jgi:hypothetical protein
VGVEDILGDMKIKMDEQGPIQKKNRTSLLLWKRKIQKNREQCIMLIAEQIGTEQIVRQL